MSKADQFLLNKAACVETVAAAVPRMGERLKGKTGYVPPRLEDETGRLVEGANPVFDDVPDPTRYVTEEDRKATRRLFVLVAQHEKVLCECLQTYRCSSSAIQPRVESLLNAANEHEAGVDTGGYWCRAGDYAGNHIWAGRNLSVPDEMARWAAKLRSEAAEPTADKAEGRQADTPDDKAPVPAPPVRRDGPTTDRWTMETRDYAADAEALQELAAACRQWGDVLRAKGWDDGDMRAKAAQTPEAKAAENRTMALVKRCEPILTYCPNSFARDPSTALDRAFDYISIYLGRGPEVLSDVPLALPDCLAFEVLQPNVGKPFREATFIVQLDRWARKLSELAASSHGNASVAVSPAAPETQDKATVRAFQKMNWLARAMAIVQCHPEWSDATIARSVGRNKSTLARNPTYKSAAKMARERDAPAKGHVDAETGQPEAYSEDQKE